MNYEQNPENVELSNTISIIIVQLYYAEYIFNIGIVYFYFGHMSVPG